MHVARHGLDGAGDDRGQCVIHLAIQQDVATAQQPLQHVLAHLAGQVAPVHILEVARQLIGVIALHVDDIRQHRDGIFVFGRGGGRAHRRRNDGRGAWCERGGVRAAGGGQLGEGDGCGGRCGLMGCCRGDAHIQQAHGMHQLVDQRPVLVGERRQGGDGGVLVQRARLVLQVVVVGVVGELRAWPGRGLACRRMGAACSVSARVGVLVIGCHLVPPHRG